MSHALSYDVPGDPLQVLSLKDFEVGSCGHKQVKVKLLAAPINPSDINTIEGKYPIQPKLPAGIPGHEGVGEVVEVGSQVTGIKAGDWVVPLGPAQGTWRSVGVFEASQWHPVPKDMPLEAAATLCINPPSALAMLENFVDLKPGDVVIQNGANSAVGQMVIQLARAKGVRTVNIVRQRNNWDETVQWLQSLGADVVTTEDKLREAVGAAGLGGAALGLNCVGGTSSTAVAKMLRKGGTMVTYGGMSMQPVIIPTSLLIFKDITVKGFWLSGGWADEIGLEGKAKLIDRLVAYAKDGKLDTKCEMVPVTKWQEAVKRYRQGDLGTKILLTF